MGQQFYIHKSAFTKNQFLKVFFIHSQLSVHNRNINILFLNVFGLLKFVIGTLVAKSFLVSQIFRCFLLQLLSLRCFVSLVKVFLIFPLVCNENDGTRL